MTLGLGDKLGRGKSYRKMIMENEAIKRHIKRYVSLLPVRLGSEHPVFGRLFGTQEGIYNSDCKK